jgi:hypothetical protein
MIKKSLRRGLGYFRKKFFYIKEVFHFQIFPAKEPSSYIIRRIQIYESNLIPYYLILTKKKIKRKKLLLFLPFTTIFIRRKYYIIKQIINIAIIVIIIIKSLNHDCIKKRRNQ